MTLLLYLYSISLRCFINHFIMACHMKLLWVLCSWHVRIRLTSPCKLWSHLHGESKRHFIGKQNMVFQQHHNNFSIRARSFMTVGIFFWCTRGFSMLKRIRFWLKFCCKTTRYGMIKHFNALQICSQSKYCKNWYMCLIILMAMFCDLL